MVLVRSLSGRCDLRLVSLPWCVKWRPIASAFSTRQRADSQMLNAGDSALFPGRASKPFGGLHPPLRWRHLRLASSCFYSPSSILFPPVQACSLFVDWTDQSAQFYSLPQLHPEGRRQDTACSHVACGGKKRTRAIREERKERYQSERDLCSGHK